MEKENPHVMVCYFIFMFNYNNNAKLVMVIWVALDSFDWNFWQVLGVIETYSHLPAMFKEKSREMFEKYYPIEIDPHIAVEEKIPLMIEWYDGAHELMKNSNLYKKDFALMVSNATNFFSKE